MAPSMAIPQPAEGLEQSRMMIRMEYTPTQENREFSIKPASVCLIYRPRRANAFYFNLPYDRVYIAFQVL